MWIKPHFEMLSSLDRNVVFLHERPLPNYEKEHGYSREPDLSEYILQRYFPKVELYPSHYPEGKEFGADIFNEGTQFMQDCDIVLRLDPDMFFEPEVWKDFIDYIRNTDFDAYRMDFAKDSVNYYMTGDYDHGLKDAQEMDPLAYNPKYRLETPVILVGGQKVPLQFQFFHGNDTVIDSKDFFCHHFRGWNKPKSTPNPEWAEQDYAKKALEQFGNNGEWFSCPPEIRQKIEEWQKELEVLKTQ